MIQEKNKQRVVAIDILKVFAVLLVLNSHMTICYPKYQFLSTGGAFGDALFFFCSGYTLYRGRLDSFGNWYKRRIARIFPSLFVVALFAAVFFHQQIDIIDVVLGRQYWFVQAIFIYYILLYLIRKYFHHLRSIFYGAIFLLLCIYYIFFNFNDQGFIYSGLVFRFFLFFIFMLQGALLGKIERLPKFRYYHILLLLLSTAGWFVIMYKWGNSSLQIISLIPLLGFTHSLLIVSNAPIFHKVYNQRILGNVLFIMGSLCLEVYLVQRYLFTDSLNFLFPLNIPIIMTGIFFVSYALNFLSKLFLQTFRKEPYHYKEMLLYKK